MSAPLPSFKRLARRAQAVSLDVVLGVLCAAWLATWLTGSRPPGVWWLVLPAATWSIYSVDRLLDARRNGARCHAFRHRFHHRYSRVLLASVLLVLAFALVGGLILLPARVVFFGLALGLAALGHLRLAQGAGIAWCPKELSAAVIYTAGIWFVPLLSTTRPDPRVLPVIVLHFLAALLNLLVYSLFERDLDDRDRQPSVVLSWGTAPVERTVRILTVSGWALAAWVAWVAWVGPRSHALAAAALAVVVSTPAVMRIRPGRMRAGERYRIWGDLVFSCLALPPLLALWGLDGRGHG